MGIHCPAPPCPVCLEAKCRHFALLDGRDYWRCEVCEATFVDLSQLLDREAELTEYELHKNDVHDAGYRKFLSRLSAPLIERLAPGLCGLDYGCGPGPALADMLREAGHLKTVYDPLFYDDPSALTQSYDFITCSEVAEHLRGMRRNGPKEIVLVDAAGRETGTTFALPYHDAPRFLALLGSQ